MRADRLLSILMLLQTRGRMTAHDLAEQLEVSERTIYRDLEALSIAGVPVYTERGPGGGCALIDGYQTRLTGLTTSEVQALFMLGSLTPLADIGLDSALDDALLKISASLPATSREQAEHMRQRVHIDAAWWGQVGDMKTTLEIVQQAIWQELRLHIVYGYDDGSRGEQVLEPYGLVAKAGDWYLVAACQSAYGVYRVARMQSVCLTGEYFVRMSDFDLAAYWSEYCKRSEAVMPAYALSLHLAPDDATNLPQMLNAFGYQLLANDEELAADEHVVALQQYRAKKKASIYKEKRLNADEQASQQLLAVGQNNRQRSWRRPAKEKKRYIKKTDLASGSQARRVLTSSGPLVSKKTYNNVQARSAEAKKKNGVLSPYIKKAPSRHNKKNGFVSGLKKTNFPANFCSPLLCA